MSKQLAACAKRAIRKAGGHTALAKAIGIERQAVSQWERRGIPVKRLLAVSEAVGMTPLELRPDLHPIFAMNPMLLKEASK